VRGAADCRMLKGWLSGEQERFRSSRLAVYLAQARMMVPYSRDRCWRAPDESGRSTREATMQPVTRLVWLVVLCGGVAGLIAGPALPASSPIQRRARTMSSPLAQHRSNPHYFLFRGQPTVLITSGEHYGAVLNRAFDYTMYLETLAWDGLNLTRIFTGAYVEHPGAFTIVRNTLAPEPGQFICPWKRSDTPGARDGGSRFDLQIWDPEYFRRLDGFLGTASKHGVVVEVCLFCPMYEDTQWERSPWFPENNINGVGKVARADVYTTDKSQGLLAVQEAMVRKIVTEVNRFDNLYFEICNEPYFGGVTLAWQAHIADLIAATEAGLPNRHLISQNIANGAQKVEQPHPKVSILTFHYANPPEAVTMNYGLDRVIGENETGFQGTGNTHYRMEAWEVLLAGGGLYNNLDYSFTAGHEQGDFAYPQTQPGGGSATLRRQLRVLKEFLAGFDFVKMRPDQEVVRGGLQEGQRARALAKAGKQYAIYVFGGKQATLSLDLPAGTYAAEWVDPVTGAVARREKAQTAEGAISLSSPDFDEDIALRIQRA